MGDHSVRSFAPTFGLGLKRHMTLDLLRHEDIFCEINSSVLLQSCQSLALGFCKNVNKNIMAAVGRSK